MFPEYSAEVQTIGVLTSHHIYISFCRGGTNARLNKKKKGTFNTTNYNGVIIVIFHGESMFPYTNIVWSFIFWLTKL